MHELGVVCAGRVGEVVALDQGDLETSEARIASHTGAGDAAANYQKVERLVGEPFEIAFHEADAPEPLSLGSGWRGVLSRNVQKNETLFTAQAGGSSNLPSHLIRHRPAERNSEVRAISQNWITRIRALVRAIG